MVQQILMFNHFLSKIIFCILSDGNSYSFQIVCLSLPIGVDSFDSQTTHLKNNINNTKLNKVKLHFAKYIYIYIVIIVRLFHAAVRPIPTAESQPDDTLFNQLRINKKAFMEMLIK